MAPGNATHCACYENLHGSNAYFLGVIAGRKEAKQEEGGVMERLTERWGEGDVWVKEHDYVSAAHRLAAYEDTGLTPELVQETAEFAIWIHEHGLEKIKEWIKADKEGRLVMLPEEEKSNG